MLSMKFEIAVMIDGFTRRIIAVRVFGRRPTTTDLVALISEVSRDPRYRFLITDNTIERVSETRCPKHALSCASTGSRPATIIRLGTNNMYFPEFVRETARAHYRLDRDCLHAARTERVPEPDGRGCAPRSGRCARRGLPHALDD